MNTINPIDKSNDSSRSGSDDDENNSNSSIENPLMRESNHETTGVAFPDNLEFGATNRRDPPTTSTETATSVSTMSAIEDTINRANSQDPYTIASEATRPVRTMVNIENVELATWTINHRDPPTSSGTVTSVRTGSTMQDTATRTVPIGELVVGDSNNQSTVQNVEHGTLAMDTSIDERTEEKDEGKVVHSENVEFTSRRVPPTSPETAMSVRTGSHAVDGIIVPTLPTGEVVDAKNTVQSYSLLAAPRTNIHNATGIRTMQPSDRHTDVGDVGGHEKWNFVESPLLAPSAAIANEIPTANVVNRIGGATSNELFVDARYLPEDDEDGAVDTVATQTPTPQQNNNSTTSTRKLGLYILLILTSVLLLGGIIFGAVCASTSCLSSSSSSSSSSPSNMSPIPPPLTNNPTTNPTTNPSSNPTSVPSYQPSMETNLPTQYFSERSSQIVAYMNSVTLSGRRIAGPYEVDSAGYILEQALSWLINDDPLYLSPDTPSNQFRMRQRYALRTLWVQQTANDLGNWHNTTGWITSSVNECEWYGISCMSVWLENDVEHQQAVTTLDLSSVHLNGNLTADLGLLSSLLYVDMKFNNLKGSLPSSIGNWKNITKVDLSSNKLSGSLPTSIGNWKSVTFVDISDNRLIGSLPDTIGNWQSVIDVDLSDNQLTGSIPTSIGNWQSVEYVYLRNNALSGSLPTSVGNWHNVTGVLLHNNQLNGSLPTIIGSWQSVTYVALNDNQFTGSLSSSVGNWKNVTFVDLSENEFTGSLPSSIGNWQSVTEVLLDNNKWTGSLPPAIGNWQSVSSVSLCCNEFSESLPTSIGSWQSVTFVSLSRNQLTGSLPTSIGNWHNVTDVLLYNNRLTGTFPKSIGTNWTNLEDAYFYNNKFTGTVPTNWCQLTSLYTLEADCVAEVICNCCTICF